MSSEETNSNKTNENPPSKESLTPTENNSPNNNSTDSPTFNENNINKKDLLKIPFVKDLIVKVDVLKNGIITERKKSSALNEQIKQLQSELSLKAEQIKNLSTEKMKIEKQLELEKKQLAKKEEGFFKMASILRTSSQSQGKFGINNNKNDSEKDNNNEIVSVMANEEINKLNEQIIKLKFENETYLKKMNMALEENENRKFEYQTIIKVQADKIKSLEQDIKKHQTEISKLHCKIEATDELATQKYREKEHFENLIRDLKKEKEEVFTQLNVCLEKCGKLMMENQTYKDSLLNHESDAAKLGEKLAEYKNMIMKINLRNQIYHCTKVGLISNSIIDVIFGQDKDGNYVMRIDEGDNVTLINIQDVEYVKLVSNDKVEISYMYDAKKYCISVLVDELVIDQFVDAYKNFYGESIKNQNKIEV